MKPQPTPERIRELLLYDPETGKFKWRDIPKVHGRCRGKPAGYLKRNGYVTFQVEGAACFAHRVAWAYVYGVFPKHQIDHINGDRSDNRISNLRDVTPQVNSQNIRVGSKSNKWGFLGVSQTHYGRFEAQIRAQGKKFHLGVYSTPEQAHAAYLSAKRRLHEGCTL